MSDNTDVSAELLKTRTAGVDFLAVDGPYKTYAEAEADHDAAFARLMETLNATPGVSIQGLSIAQRLVAGGMSPEDAAIEAARSTDPNEF